MDMQSTHNASVTSPLLYRLIDDAPESQIETRDHRQVDMDTLHQLIRDNLEYLFNTQRTLQEVPKHLPELKQSLLNYGTPNFMHHRFGAREEQLSLCRELREMIQCFEPRLTNVNVTLLNENTNTERLLKIRIDAAIYLHPNLIPATFESTFDLATTDMTVTK